MAVEALNPLHHATLNRAPTSASSSHSFSSAPSHVAETAKYSTSPVPDNNDSGGNLYSIFGFPLSIAQYEAFADASRGIYKRQLQFQWQPYLVAIGLSLFSPLSLALCALNAWGFVHIKPLDGVWPQQWLTSEQKTLQDRRLGKTRNVMIMQRGMVVIIFTVPAVYATIAIWLAIRLNITSNDVEAPTNRLILDISIYHFLVTFGCVLFSGYSYGSLRRSPTGRVYNSPFLSKDSELQFRIISLEVDVGYLQSLYPLAQFTLEYQAWYAFISDPKLRAIRDEVSAYVTVDDWQHTLAQTGRETTQRVQVPAILLAAVISQMCSQSITRVKRRLLIAMIWAVVAGITPPVFRAIIKSWPSSGYDGEVFGGSSQLGLTAVYILCLIVDCLTFYTALTCTVGFGSGTYAHWAQLESLHNCVTIDTQNGTASAYTTSTLSELTGAIPQRIINLDCPANIRAYLACRRMLLVYHKQLLDFANVTPIAYLCAITIYIVVTIVLVSGNVAAVSQAVQAYVGAVSLTAVCFLASVILPILSFGALSNACAAKDLHMLNECRLQVSNRSRYRVLRDDSLTAPGPSDVVHELSLAYETVKLDSERVSQQLYCYISVQSVTWCQVCGTEYNMI